MWLSRFDDESSPGLSWVMLGNKNTFQKHDMHQCRSCIEAEHTCGNGYKGFDEDHAYNTLPAKSLRYVTDHSELGL